MLRKKKKKKKKKKYKETKEDAGHTKRRKNRTALVSSSTFTWKTCARRVHLEAVENGKREGRWIIIRKQERHEMLRESYE